MGLRKKISSNSDRLTQKYWRIRRLFISDPVKIAHAWRKLGVSIGKGTLIYRDVKLGGGGTDPIIIGENCVLTGCTILGHDASTNKALGLKRSIRHAVYIEDNCFIGYGAIILMGVRVGQGAIVGAGSVVTKDVPPGSVVAGNPARVICSVSALVEKRQQYLHEREFD